MVEPVSVAVQICKVADLRANQTVVVFGAGPIGVLSQAVAKASGASKVIAVDISQARLDFAKSYAADHVFLPPRADPNSDPVAHSEKFAAMIKEQFGLGEGADIVLECTGAEPCIQAGINVAKKGGTYVQAGMGKEVSPMSSQTCSPQELTDDILECYISYHHSLYPSPHNQGVYTILDWLLSECCGACSLRKSRCEATNHEPVQI